MVCQFIGLEDFFGWCEAGHHYIFHTILIVSHRSASFSPMLAEARRPYKESCLLLSDVLSLQSV